MANPIHSPPGQTEVQGVHHSLPVRPLHNPLTSEDEATLDAAIAKTAVHHDLIQRMKQAGMDVAEQENRNAMHHHVATTLKTMFFPPTMSPPVE
jgi:hypothetical protein